MMNGEGNTKGGDPRSSPRRPSLHRAVSRVLSRHCELQRRLAYDSRRAVPGDSVDAD